VPALSQLNTKHRGDNAAAANRGIAGNANFERSSDLFFAFSLSHSRLASKNYERRVQL